MNVKKFSWTRPLALFVALTMIMMYSVGGVALAAPGEYTVTYNAGGPKAESYPSGTTVTVGAIAEGYAWELNGNDIDLSHKIGTLYYPGDTFAMPENNINFKKVRLDGVPEFDLAITKIANVDSVVVGQNVTYTITVTNKSENSVSGVSVTEAWPTSMEVVSFDDGNTTYENNIWTIGTLAAGSSTSLQIIAKATATSTGIVNTVTVTSEGIDLNLSDNTATETVIVTDPPAPVRDLAVMKTVNDNTVTVGDKVIFTIMAQNIGNTSMESVTVQDVLPAGLSQSAVTSSENTSFVGSTWTIGTLGPNEIKYLTISAVTLTVGNVSNTATGTGTDDVNNNNNTSTVDVTVSAVVVNPTYDLDITKVVDDSTVALDDEVTFTITARNLGNSTISDVVVTDTLPVGLSLSGVTYSAGTTFSGVTWEIGDIEANEFKTLTITAIAQTAGEFTNVAVGTSVEDEDSDNNTDSATVTVTLVEEPDRDLGVTKTVNLGSVLVNTGVTFTVTILNNGDTTYEGVEVSDVWPSGLTQGTATPAEGTTFDAVNNIWEVGTIGPGEAKVLTIAAGTPTTGTYTNKVEILGVEGTWSDDNANNNTASAIVTVTTEDDGDNNTPTRRTTTPTPTDIPEVEPPLIDAPVIEPEIVDEPTPLADVPQTDDTSNIFLLLGLMLASGAGIAALGRRKETVEK